MVCSGNNNFPPTQALDGLFNAAKEIGSRPGNFIAALEHFLTIQASPLYQRIDLRTYRHSGAGDRTLVEIIGGKKGFERLQTDLEKETLGHLRELLEPTPADAEKLKELLKLAVQAFKDPMPFHAALVKSGELLEKYPRYRETLYEMLGTNTAGLIIAMQWLDKLFDSAGKAFDSSATAEDFVSKYTAFNFFKNKIDLQLDPLKYKHPVYNQTLLELLGGERNAGTLHSKLAKKEQLDFLTSVGILPPSLRDVKKKDDVMLPLASALQQIAAK